MSDPSLTRIVPTGGVARTGVMLGVSPPKTPIFLGKSTTQGIRMHGKVATKNAPLDHRARPSGARQAVARAASSAHGRPVPPPLPRSAVSFVVSGGGPGRSDACDLPALPPEIEGRGVIDREAPPRNGWTRRSTAAPRRSPSARSVRSPGVGIWSGVAPEAEPIREIRVADGELARCSCITTTASSAMIPSATSPKNRVLRPRPLRPVIAMLPAFAPSRARDRRRGRTQQRRRGRPACRWRQASAPRCSLPPTGGSRRCAAPPVSARWNGAIRRPASSARCITSGPHLGYRRRAFPAGGTPSPFCR